MGSFSSEIGSPTFPSLERGLSTPSRSRMAENLRLELPRRTLGGKSTANGFQTAPWNAWSERRSQRKITSRSATQFPLLLVTSPRFPLHSQSRPSSRQAVQRMRLSGFRSPPPNRSLTARHKTPSHLLPLWQSR